MRNSPDAFAVSKNRLASSTKRLRDDSDKQIVKDNGDIFVDYEKRGVIERFPDNEIAKETVIIRHTKGRQRFFPFLMVRVR